MQGTWRGNGDADLRVTNRVVGRESVRSLALVHQSEVLAAFALWVRVISAFSLMPLSSRGNGYGGTANRHSERLAERGAARELAAGPLPLAVHPRASGVGPRTHASALVAAAWTRLCPCPRKGSMLFEQAPLLDKGIGSPLPLARFLLTSSSSSFPSHHCDVSFPSQHVYRLQGDSRLRKSASPCWKTRLLLLPGAG